MNAMPFDYTPVPLPDLILRKQNMNHPFKEALLVKDQSTALYSVKIRHRKTCEVLMCFPYVDNLELALSIWMKEVNGE